MGKWGAAMAVMAGLMAGAASAQERLVVVELYTSQGCSSCPPGDAILKDLAGMAGVLPLALHVDYWDYIGWTDSFGQPEFTLRQESYARSVGESTIYTPQMIIGGTDVVVGAHAMSVMDAIRAHAALPPDIVVDLTRQGGALRVALRASGPDNGPMVVQLVRFDPSASVEITRGENAGRTLTSTNIVTQWQILGEWDGTAPLVLEVEVEGEDEVAVLVQKAGPGLILAAALLD